MEETAKTALDQLGYKIHVASNHGEFLHRFSTIPYQVVIIDELFSSSSVEENESLLTLQRMPMHMRRHTVAILIGFSLSTFNPMQAFQQSVHAVVNPAEMFLLIQLIESRLQTTTISSTIPRSPTAGGLTGSPRTRETPPAGGVLLL